MENNSDEIINDKPPFFKKWSGLYIFILLFELALIILFIWITNNYQG